MWQVLDLAEWTVAADELRGVRKKRWMRAPAGLDDVSASSKWLVKFPRARSPYEPATEVFALELARQVGIDAATGRLAVSPGPHGAVQAIAVRSFVPETAAPEDEPVKPTSALSLGHTLLKSVDQTYSASNHEGHTLTRVRSVLATRTKDPEASLRSFVSVLLFDAWVGNSDRHQANWGVLQSRSGELGLAPMYDPASCLGVELQAGHALLDPHAPDTAIDNYVTNCPSGFGNDSHLLPMRDVVSELLRTWPEAASASMAWLVRYEVARRDIVPEILATAPESFWPAARRDLAARILDRRLDWLKAAVKQGGRR